MQRLFSLRTLSWMAGGLIVGTMGLAGCHDDHDNDHHGHDHDMHDSRDVRGDDHAYWDETRVVIRDDQGLDHHGYYDRNGGWHGGFYDGHHDFHNDAAEWARGRERVARKEGAAEMYDRNGQEKGWDANRR